MEQHHFDGSPDCLAKVKRIFDPLEACAVNAENAPIQNANDFNERARKVHGILHGRLAKHIDRHFATSKSQKENLVWEFARKNLGRVAFAMTSLDQTIDDVEVARWNPNLSLLRNPQINSFAMASTKEAQELEGCYLFFTKVTHEFVRSGMVVGNDRNIGKRCKEHSIRAKCQAVKDMDSRFYTRYPSRESDRQGDGIRLGQFEDLELHCGLSFSRKDMDEVIDFFDWEESFLKAVSKGKGKDEESLKEDKFRITGHLVELCDELAISPLHDVSISPGFEPLLGVFGGGDDWN